MGEAFPARSRYSGVMRPLRGWLALAALLSGCSGIQTSLGANGLRHRRCDEGPGEWRADSELLIKQMKGVYRVKNPGLQLLFQDAQSLVARLPRVTFEHVRRELNKDADRLANEAMDAAAGL